MMVQRRSLTPGEVALARSVFADAIDYSKVRVVRGKWWALQPRHVTMAPTGNIHFHPDSANWSEDFAAAPIDLQAHFIHEMTHVWQAQVGGRWYLPLMRHPFCRYDYRLVPGKPFRAYGIEQQAQIVAHAFLAARGRLSPSVPPPPASLLPFGEAQSASPERHRIDPKVS